MLIICISKLVFSSVIGIEDDGTVHIYASKQKGLDRAKAMIDRMSREIDLGRAYTGKGVSNTQFGAFMEVLLGLPFEKMPPLMMPYEVC